MRLLELGIHNYKSIRSVSFTPGHLSVLVGPNGAGKSNLCDALDFIGDMYRWGLEPAVARHGGYENICYRHSRRSKAPIRLRVRSEFAPSEALVALREMGGTLMPLGLRLDHEIEFGTESQRIEAPFSISRESVSIGQVSTRGEASHDLIRYVRVGDRITLTRVDPARLHELSGGEWPASLIEELADPQRSLPLGGTQSAIAALDRWLFPLFDVWWLLRGLGSTRVFQLGPAECRQAGVPVPNPELERSGLNLPAVIQFIKANRPDQYRALLATLRKVMPALEELNVAVTPRKTLGLSFQEKGFRSPWSADDVSDGTIRALAMLATIFDPDLSLVAVEEPENSLHPWAIRQFVDACRVAAHGKQIILTTHSPILINHLEPKEVWVVQRPPLEGATRLDPLVRLDPTAAAKWERSRFALAEYLDAR